MCLARVQDTERGTWKKPALSLRINELGSKESSLILSKSTEANHEEGPAFHP